MSLQKPIVYNLDEKVKPPEVIILGGVEMDISFIPCGVSIPLLKAYDEYVKHLTEHGSSIIKNDLEKAKENADLVIKVVTIFTKFKDPKLHEEWILNNCDMKQIGFLMTKLINTIMSSISSNEDDNKKKENADGNE